MNDFRVGDRVRRINRFYEEIEVGFVGTVVKVSHLDVRVRYDKAFSFEPDGAFGQAKENLEFAGHPVSSHELDALAYTEPMSVMEAEWRKVEKHLFPSDPPVTATEFVLSAWRREREESAARRRAGVEGVLNPLRPAERDHLIDAMRYAYMAETPHRDPCPALGPDLGMFIRDGMTTGEARLALANRIVEQHEKRQRVSPPKICATLPSKPKGRLHKTPRAWGWLNVKLGIGSSKHVQWEVSAPLDAFGRET